MPSPLKRIQVLCEPDLHAAIQTIARGRNMTLSATCAQMLGQLLNTPEMRKEYEESATKFGAYEPQQDSRQKRNQQPHFKTYEEPTAEWAQKPGADGLSMNEKIKLINAKHAGVKDKEITEAAQQDDKESKKAMLKELLLEIMSEA